MPDVESKEDTTTTTDKAVEPPVTKQAKLMNSYPQAPPEEWPQAWLLPETVQDQCLENHLSPDVPVTVDELKELGIAYWKMDAESFDYPVKAVPWDPKDAMDPKLKALRDDRGYR